ncbi:hypothetical protein K2X14_05660 [Acetobacter sp. TBRC 12305]|uniref:DUF6468 domain-containing protein n=1 Tax=Acetobacter garciniae TaxID=2817435 RepID=A0A939HNF7_9PROT|nr:DUF6468 domain-containing protein [Acetobacter garciniae]MBO1324637.1 hypothetical protein [Acetobacter garciniae]MBX0344326.1 hypothetical protein [Acetobacter garciniae]
MLTQIQMIIEIVLSFFLLLGIVYSFYLGRILSNLKRDRASLLALVEKLESSVKSAEEGVEKLRIAGEVSGRPLSRMIEQAKMAGVELDSVVSKADATADRIEILATQLPSQEKRLGNLVEQASAIRITLIKEAESLLAEAGGPVASAADAAQAPASTSPAEGQKALSSSAQAAQGEGSVKPQTVLSTTDKPALTTPPLRKEPNLQMLEKTFLGRQDGQNEPKAPIVGPNSNAGRNKTRGRR